MSKSKKPTDLDAGMAPEKVPAPGREPKDTDRDWPAPGVPLSEVGGVEPLPPGAVFITPEDIMDANRILAERRAEATMAVPKDLPTTSSAAAEAALLALEARCAAGGSAGLADIRAVLKVLRGD